MTHFSPPTAMSLVVLNKHLIMQITDNVERTRYLENLVIIMALQDGQVWEDAEELLITNLMSSVNTLLMQGWEIHKVHNLAQDPVVIRNIVNLFQMLNADVNRCVQELNVFANMLAHAQSVESKNNIPFLMRGEKV
jgi:hypothetical protein